LVVKKRYLLRDNVASCHNVEVIIGV